jgi:general secretion pathway protein D
MERFNAFCFSLVPRTLLLLTCLLAGSVHAENITLNLKNADINALIDTVSDKTGKNFIVDPRVKGKVTVISSQPMDSEELYQVFLSILQVHGFSAVPSGNVIKIIPDASAKQANIPTVNLRAPGVGDEMVTRVITLENISASQLVPILRPLIPQHGHLAAYARTNVLIITDRAANINRLVKIIKRIDLEGDNDIEVIRLEHASASEIVKIITSLGQKDTKGAPTAGRPILVADERTNSILMTGDRSTRIRMRTIITHLDTPLESGGNTTVIYLHYAKAKDLVPILTGVSTNITQIKRPKGKTLRIPSKGNKVSIEADEQTNALVITAPPDIMRSLQAVIKKLDIRRAQVLVEAIIVEVSSTKGAELGVQWSSSPSTSGTNTTVGGTAFSGENAGAINSFNISSLPLGLSIGQFTNGTIRGLLRALASDSKTNVLSTPNLVTLDNQEAEIIVGENVPFVTGQFTNSNSDPDNPFQTIERHDVGIVLKVKPQINEGNAIKLDIEQEVSSVQKGTSGTSLITNKRSIKTSVLVDDKQIIVLGGLIKDSLLESEDKVPLLGDIPLLGMLFRNTTTNLVKTNLMVFLRPEILRNGQDTFIQTNSKYDFMRKLQQQRREEGVSLMYDNVAPILPKLGLKLPPPYQQTDEDINSIQGVINDNAESATRSAVGTEE